MSAAKPAHREFSVARFESIAQLSHADQITTGENRVEAGAEHHPISAIRCSYGKCPIGNLYLRSLFKIEAPDGSLKSVAFAPEGALLAAGAMAGAIRVWRISDGALLHTLTGHALMAGRIAFSPDGKRLASIAFDHQVRLWQVADGSLLPRLAGHSQEIERMAFSPDRTTLVTTGDKHLHAR